MGLWAPGPLACCGQPTRALAERASDHRKPQTLSVPLGLEESRVLPILTLIELVIAASLSRLGTALAVDGYVRIVAIFVGFEHDRALLSPRSPHRRFTLDGRVPQVHHVARCLRSAHPCLPITRTVRGRQVRVAVGVHGPLGLGAPGRGRRWALGAQRHESPGRERWFGNNSGATRGTSQGTRGTRQPGHSCRFRTRLEAPRHPSPPSVRLGNVPYLGSLEWTRM
mgnify:CR=1 FL=1